MAMDDRFIRVLTDPRFKKISKKERKVKIDARFQKMFTDKRFHTKFSVDKRGKPLHETEKEDLHKFYELDEEEGVHDQKSKQCNNSKVELKEGKEQKTKNSNKKEAEDKKRKGAKKHQIDFEDIRGRDLNGSSSDSDYASDVEIAEEDLQEGIVHGWGNLDEDAKRIENAETARLAVCNIDWDRITANDLFVLFNSFKPTGGVILSVKIYPSEFGIERMKEEELIGPQELKEVFPKGEQDEASEDENVEGSSYHMEKLREYQLKRLKYYYAVVQCDSKETANKLYEECDGMEYEMSATRLDLRFIPDDTTFDHVPKSEAHEMPNGKHYEPMRFMNTALQQSTVRLTWDESDPKRLQSTMKKFTQEDLEKMDFKDYLASSSSDEDENGAIRKDEQSEMDRNNRVNKDLDEDSGNDDELRIKKYRLLMQEIEAKEKKEKEGESDLDIDVAWEEGSEKDGEIDKGKYEKEKKEDRCEEEKSDVDDAVTDLFFQNDEAERNIKTGSTSKKKKGNKKKLRERNDTNLTEEELKQKNELELLLLDESEEKKHFSYKDILEQENMKKSKKKRRKNKQDVLNRPEDTFQIDVKDDRFKALYSSHLFALDPSEPSFKKSKATDAIIKEVQKRRTQEIDNEENLRESKSIKLLDSSLSALVKSVKSKSASHQASLKKKKKLK